MIDAHVISILSQPDLTEESGQTLKELMDVTTENIRALKSLKIDVDFLDPVLLLLFVQNLNPSTRRLWEQCLKPKIRATMREFLKFLANRFYALGCQQKSNFSIESTVDQRSKRNFAGENVRYKPSSASCQAQGTMFPPRVHTVSSEVGDVNVTLRFFETLVSSTSRANRANNLEMFRYF